MEMWESFFQLFKLTSCIPMQKMAPLIGQEIFRKREGDDHDRSKKFSSQ